MKSLFNKYIWLQFILSVLLLFAGALIVAFSIKDLEVVRDGGQPIIISRGLNIIFAVILFLFGLFAIVASFAFEPNKVITNGIVYGSASIAMGVFLCTDKFEMLNYLVYLLAIFFIVVGAIEIIKAIILLVKKAGKLVVLIISIVIGAIFIAGGIVSLIFDKQAEIIYCFIAAVLLILIGLYLLVTGVIYLIGGIKGNKGNKPAKKEKETKNKEKPVDEEVEYEAPQELDYTAEVPAIEENNKEPTQQEIETSKE